MVGWWRTQTRTTRIVVGALIAAIGVALALRLLPEERPPLLIKPLVPSTGEPSPVQGPPVACPPDSELLDFASPGSTLSGHLCVGEYVSVWSSSTPGYEPTLMILRRHAGAGLGIVDLDVLGEYTPFCRRAEDVARLPAQILERTGCQYWGRTPPVDSPHMQVFAAQQRFFAAVDADDAATVCAMLAPAALRAVEEDGRRCAHALPRIRNMLDEAIELGRSQSPTLVQATNEYAQTAGPPPAGAETVLAWKRDNGVWKVSYLACSTYDLIC